MATTTFYEKTLKDLQSNEQLDLEFGRSSYYGDSHVYICVNGQSVIIDDDTALKIIEKFNDLGSYLGLLGRKT